jgi:flavin-dependent dehydrogenase
VRKVGLFAGSECLEADLPRPPESGSEFGRALCRERLDALLLDQAREEGAEVRQPWSLTDICLARDRFRLIGKDLATSTTEELSARLAIAAHGSWNSGALATQPPRQPSAPSDLFGFKAHFSKSRLPEDLMPLLSFHGGYGGMVHSDDGRVSLSCCVRRDCLHALRQRVPGEAGVAVQQYLEESCRGVRDALAGAQRDGEWLSAGPIRPGIRLPSRVLNADGLFLVGNAAGEAHPVVAEGISMAIQSSWLLSSRLTAWSRAGACRAALRRVAYAYASDWRRHFAPRVLASQAIAAWAMRPWAVAGSMPLLRRFPILLNWGARLSGKAEPVRVPALFVGRVS